MLQSMGLQRVRHVLATEQQQNNLIKIEHLSHYYRECLGASDCAKHIG